MAMTYYCVFVLALLACCLAFVTGAPCSTSCTWESWLSWGSCSSSCGGGQQIRTRDACCRGDATFNQCMAECHMQSTDSSERRCCSTNCYNGGKWTYRDRPTCSGNCICPKGFKGNCCETKCSNIQHCLTGEIECNFLSGRCTKCQSPYISTEWQGTCRAPSCFPRCEHNGTCIADDVCDCAPGYLGSRCQMGGSLDAFLLPTLHAVEEMPFQPLSWYDNPPFSDFGRVCYLKVEITNGSLEALFTSISLSTDGRSYGNFTTGPIDIHGGLNDTKRTACLQYRCPTTINGDSHSHTNISVFPITRAGICKVRNTNPLMNVSVNVLPHGHDSIMLTTQSSDNYGPNYGLYIGMGTRDTAIYATRQQCLSGFNFDVERINPSVGILAEYVCT